MNPLKNFVRQRFCPCQHFPFHAKCNVRRTEISASQIFVRQKVYLDKVFVNKFNGPVFTTP